MNCHICKTGETKPGEVTVPLERGNSIVLLKQVPAEVCQNCGSYYLSSEISEKVLAQGEEAIANGAELEVSRLRIAG